MLEIESEVIAFGSRSPRPHDIQYDVNRDRRRLGGTHRTIAAEVMEAELAIKRIVLGRL